MMFFSLFSNRKAEKERALTEAMSAQEQLTFGDEALGRIRANLPPVTAPAHFCVWANPRNGHSYTILVDYFAHRKRYFVLEVDICIKRDTLRALLGREMIEMSPDQIDGFLLRVSHYLRHWHMPEASITA